MINSDTGQGTPNKANRQASEQAQAREQAAGPNEVPVKQHNPKEQGINPQQKGPAQPTGNSA